MGRESITYSLQAITLAHAQHARTEANIIYFILVNISVIYLMYDRILVAVDGSEPSFKALDQAVELGLKLGSEIAVVSVVDKLNLPFAAEYGLWAQESHNNLVRKVLESLNSSILRLKENHPELKLEAIIENGRPAKKIVELAEDEGFDLIVIGRRGNGFAEHLIMGSVSNEVVRTSSKPVLVVE